MFSVKSLRTKAVLWALIPTTLVLVVAAIIALYAYERAARDVVQQRDTEMARVLAARLSENLDRYSLILQTIAARDDVQSLEPIRLGAELSEARDQLYVFDAGVVVYNIEGVVVRSQPLAPGRQGTYFPDMPRFDRMRRTLRPTSSNIFEDAASGQSVVLVGVPIVRGEDEFQGVLAGMFAIGHSSLDAVYADVLEFKADQSGYAYLVDGNGRVVYHRDTSLLGEYLPVDELIVRATEGGTGALIVRDSTGEQVISGFAPVPGTDWSLITQERWDNVVGPIQGYSKLLLGLLMSGGVVSSVLIFSAMGRILRPIKDLTWGAQRISGGDFDHTITAETGDEIQALAQQFNTMAGALKESYADLERRVADRTRELRESEERLRATIMGAPLVLFVTDEDGVFTMAEGKGLEALGLQSGEIVGQFILDVYKDVPGVAENVNRAMEGEEFTSVIRMGESTFETRYSPLRAENGRIIGIVGVAVDVTERERAGEALLGQARELAVIEERNRMAREIHDTLAQGFTGIVLQLEAGEQALESNPAEVQEHLDRARALARDSLQAARRSVWNLLPEALEHRSLEDALQQEVEQLTAQHRVVATFNAVRDRQELPPDVQAALFRICQESLMNVRRHAQATKVEVALEFQTGAVCLTIRDDGVGFDPANRRVLTRGGSFGLSGMEQRAFSVGGKLSVESQKSEGTLIEVRIPVE